MTDKVAFRGGYTCSCVATSLPLLEEIMILNGLISNSIDIYQLGYRDDVSASAGTHSKGGCTDIAQMDDDCLAIERKYGWTFQHRTQAQGFTPHAHGWPNGCSHLSSSAQYQQQAWNNGRDGLVSNGPITGPGPKGTDTPHWTDGVAQMRKDIMSVKNDIVNEVVARLLPAINAVPGRTVNSVGINVSTNPRKPANWSLGHILSWTQRSVANKDQIAALDAKVNGLTALVNGLVKK